MPVQTTYTVAPQAAYAGMLADDTENDILTMANGEASASMPFGIAVAFKTSSPPSDKSGVLPTAGETKIAGILVHSHDYERSFTFPDGTVVGENDGTGIKAGAEIAVLWRGCIWVKVQQAVVPGDRPFICNAVGAGNAYTALGQFGNANDATGGGTTIDLSNIGRYTSAAAAGGFAKLQIDFSQKP